MSSTNHGHDAEMQFYAVLDGEWTMAQEYAAETEQTEAWISDTVAAITEGR